MQRYGRGRYRLGRKHKSARTLPALVPPLWIAWMMLAIPIGLVWQPWLWLVAVSVMIYSSVIMTETLRIAKKSPAKSALWIPLVFAGIHLGFGYGFWRELFTTFRSAKPQEGLAVLNRQTLNV